MDEQTRQLIGEELVPMEAKPGQVMRYDNQYVRNQHQWAHNGKRRETVLSSPLRSLCLCGQFNNRKGAKDARKLRTICSRGWYSFAIML
jgi:hypothetical protein